MKKYSIQISKEALENLRGFVSELEGDSKDKAITIITAMIGQIPTAEYSYIFENAKQRDALKKRLAKRLDMEVSELETSFDVTGYTETPKGFAIKEEYTAIVDKLVEAGQSREVIGKVNKSRGSVHGVSVPGRISRPTAKTYPEVMDELLVIAGDSRAIRGEAAYRKELLTSLEEASENAYARGPKARLKEMKELLACCRIDEKKQPVVDELVKTAAGLL